jgi:dihydrofolate synthase/folylpolyglutamate synthase
LSHCFNALKRIITSAMQQALLERLFARRRFGMRPGLETTRALLARLDHPEEGLAAIHVAGTNGKGSVTAMIAAVLTAAGLPTGRYTSPHLARFAERICINDRPVDDAPLEAALLEVEAAAAALEDAGGQPPTFFECATAAALLVLRRAGIRLAVIETGLGGRLDATNVLTPLTAVITRIGLEHCAQLGDTLEAIAGEKAGIIKPGRPVVIGAMPEEAGDVMRRVAAERRAPLVDAAETVTLTGVSMTLEGLEARVATPTRDLGRVRLALAGAYQAENLATAVAALETAAATLGLALPDQAFHDGLGRVCWPGRFQLVSRAPPILVDGAHNPDAAQALRLALRRAKIKGPVALVAGLCDDKDAGAFLRTLASAAARAWAVPVPSPRSRPAAETAALMRAAGIAEVESATLPQALAEARAWALREQGLVLVCGSLFLAGEALVLLDAYPWPLDAAQTLEPNEQPRPDGAAARP